MPAAATVPPAAVAGSLQPAASPPGQSVGCEPAHRAAHPPPRCGWPHLHAVRARQRVRQAGGRAGGRAGGQQYVEPERARGWTLAGIGLLRAGARKSRSGRSRAAADAAGHAPTCRQGMQHAAPQRQQGVGGVPDAALPQYHHLQAAQGRHARQAAAVRALSRGWHPLLSESSAVSQRGNSGTHQHPQAIAGAAIMQHPTCPNLGCSLCQSNSSTSMEQMGCGSVCDEQAQRPAAATAAAAAAAAKTAAAGESALAPQEEVCRGRGRAGAGCMAPW